MSFQRVQILDAIETATLVSLLAERHFVDGKETAVGGAREVKNNLQAGRESSEHTEADRIIVVALNRNKAFQQYAIPRRMKLPVFNRYEVGMYYGSHVDAPVVGKGDGQMRTDLSMTIFLSSPGSYDGGELILETGFGEEEIKLEAGEAIVYPSVYVHRVAPVTRGVRMAAVIWIQSVVRDERLRTILFDLSLVTSHSQMAGNTELATLLSKCRNNLMRFASEV